MIIVKVIGGLGNQMFQVAYAKMLSEEYEEEIYLDISAYERYKIRSYSLSNLNISNSVKLIEDANLSKIDKLYLKSTQKAYHLYQKIVKETTKVDKFGEKPFKFLSNRGLYYNFDRYYYNSNLNTNRLKCIYGYFQSENYFMKYKEKIKEELKVKTPPTIREQKLLDEIRSCNAIGVSMRLGDDYVKSPSLNICQEEFYYKAMEEIYMKNRNAKFYIFSDRVDRAKENYNFKFPVQYVEGFKDYESLRLLYSCNHFVLSNSSFSWWGAYLSSNTEKQIIVPSKWYNDSYEQPAIYLDNMILLEV